MYMCSSCLETACFFVEQQQAFSSCESQVSKYLVEQSKRAAR